MKLFGHPMSMCTRRVLAILHAKEAAFDLVMVDTRAGEQKQLAHLARQPFGLVPALEHDGFMLYESRAICRYLDEVLPGQRLTPTAPRERALMEQWLSVETSNFSPPAGNIIVEALFKRLRGGQPDQAIIEASKVKVAECVAVMEAQLQRTAFIAGDALTLADISFLPVMDYLYAGQQGDVIERSGVVSAWGRRLSALPFWKNATNVRR